MVVADDIDIGINAELSFVIVDQGVIFGASFDPFSVRNDDGTAEIFLSDPSGIDFEKQKNYTVVLRVSDNGSPTRSSDISVIVTIMDVDDNLPKFPQSAYSATILETIPVGQFILTVKAFDRDTVDVGFSHQIRDYSALSFFQINPVTGDISLQLPLNHEDMHTHYIVVEVTDAASFNAVTDTANVTIYVTDVNDLKPFFLPISAVSISEGSYTNENVTTLTVVDFDDQHNPEDVVFTILSESARFSIVNRTDPNNTSVTLGDLILTGDIDYETQTLIAVTIQVFDERDSSSAQTAIATVFITVINLDDEDPVFDFSLYSATVSELAAVDTSVLAVHADDPDVGVVLSYFITQRIFPVSNAPFKINLNSGLIQVSASTLDFETIKYFTIEVCLL